MKKQIVTSTFIFATLFGPGASAQNSDRFTGSLLWRVSGNGLDAPSYIFGTHHLIGMEIIDSIDGFYDALDIVVKVVGELNMSDPSIPDKMQRAMILPEGYSYKEMLGEEEYEFLCDNIIDAIGLPMDHAERLHPAALLSYYTISLYGKSEPEYDILKHVAIDTYIQNYARQKGLPVSGLEEVDDQIKVLYVTDSIEIAARELVCSIRNSRMILESLKSLNQCYMQADLYSLFEMARGDSEQNPCMLGYTNSEAILEGRNSAWLEKLPGILSEGSAFIAVGALHLAGETGILAGLERMGYTVEPVK